MFSQLFSRMVGRGCGSCGPTSSRRQCRRAQRIAAAAGQTMDALESRVLLSTIYVDASAPGPTYTGSSWTTAYKDLKLALSAAVAGDVFRVADGTYKPTSIANRTISFVLRDGVSIYGGYAGYGASNPNVRNIALYPTILSGDIGTAGTKTDNSYHVLTASGVGTSTALDGITITGGYANGARWDGYGYGGGLYATESSPKLTNCIFVGNSASIAGGGMYAGFSSSPTLTNCTFGGNYTIDSDSYGGGMFNFASSSPTLTNCTFSGNYTTGTSRGGGICNSSSSPTLTNCTFSGNFATGAGGAMYNTSSSPTLTNCIVWGNAIANTSSTPVVTYSLIQGGYAGIGNINADPLFVRSPWTGPDGIFGTADDDFGDLRLRTGSPAINVGSNAAVSAVSTDLAGNARIQSGTVDLGVYEGPTTVVPKNFYVDGAAIGGNSGSSWANAFTSLAPALAAAIDGDTIRIADGTYRPTTTTDRTISFAVRNAVAIYGGYAGYGASDPEARDTALYATILSGDIGTAGSTTDNSYHVLTATSVNALTILDGITVTGGNASGSGTSRSGGGLHATNASPRLIDCIFSGNSASGINACGGGIYSASSAPTLINCTFSGNSASTYGAGMYNFSSSPTLANCVFTSNLAGVGGGMSNANSSSPTLTNCIFSGNSATANGGGMYNFTSSPILTNCTFSSNAAGNASAMHNASSSSPTLTNCIIWNHADGGFSNSSGELVITYSIIQGGYAGTGNTDTDPLFVRSPWAGPDGRFGTADDDPGDLRLREGSPALDHGTNVAVFGISTDLAGIPRIQNSTVDMGAYEGSTVAPASRTFYVDAAATGANTGVTWRNAFTSLASALAATGDGDIIRIAGGTYTPTTTSDRTLGFALRNGVAIYGGYAAYGAPDPDVRDTALYATILSGNIGAVDSITDNSYRVLTAAGVGPLTILDGVTVTAGNANGTGANQSHGGGLFVTGASPTLVNCSFSGNSASNSGGGMYNVSFSSPMLANCTFSGNSASEGGGMYNESSSPPTLVNCSFSGNSAAKGGGMCNLSSAPTLTNCTFGENSASSHGGGMYNSSSLAKLTNCVFSRNSAISGGGMYNASSSPALTDCTFSANSARVHYGGGMHNSTSSSPTLINCVFSGNSASGTFSSGGAMYNYESSSPTLTNCTFSGNSASRAGGGVYSMSWSIPTLTNCILWGNTASSSPQVFQSSDAPIITYSNIQGGHVGTGNIDADPLFIRNPSPGPDGLWNGIGDDYGDLRLRPESPCIDAGNNAASGLGGITTDLAGRPRFVDIALTPDTGFGPAPIVDLGAYETQRWCPLWLDPADSAAWNGSTQTLDIGNTILVVPADDTNRAGRLAAIRQFISAGRGGGAGIVSSAVGEDEGVIAALDAGGNILVRVALTGDVTLDDQIDGDDYFAMDMAFLAGGGLRPAADVNVDGVVDGRDYLVLDLRFLRSPTGGVQQAAGVPVEQAGEQVPAGVFSVRSIAEELLMEEATVLA